jgi:glycyl-tRNA synthetase (class II)
MNPLFVSVPTRIEFVCCTDFILRDQEACVTPSAVSRQSAVLKANTTLDIFTDVLCKCFTSPNIRRVVFK